MLSARIETIILLTIPLKIARYQTGMDRNGIGLCVALCSTRLLKINLIAPYTGAWIEITARKELYSEHYKQFRKYNLLLYGHLRRTLLCDAHPILRTHHTRSIQET